MSESAPLDGLGESSDRLPGRPPPGPVLMVCSSGGHLAQLMALRSWWETKEDVRWVTFETTDAVSVLRGHDVTYAHHPTTRNIPNAVRNFGQALKVIHRQRPSLIVSSGAGVAVPYFVAAWLYRVPRVYIEVVDRIETPTLTGRLCRPFATRFLVQWEAQREMYRGSELVGVLL
jgi:UDP-N-acetylglucosamine:LPS N-acetylglucosamine transferase